MTSTTSWLAKGKVLPPEGERKNLDHRFDAFGGVDQQVGAAVLPQQLAAPPAGHEDVPPEVDAGEGDEPSATAGVQRRNQPTLGAETEAVRRVLDVAADDHPPVVDERGRSHRELGVGRVGLAHRFQGGPAKPRPVDRLRHQPTVYGWPSAAGARTRPTKPATATRVAMYGAVSRRSELTGGLACPMRN